MNTHARLISSLFDVKVSGEDKPQRLSSSNGAPPAVRGCTPASTEVRLIDFGTAEFCAGHKQRHALVGTRQYRAPEVLFGSGWDATLDVWAVACVTTEMLCGRQLFPAVSNDELQQKEEGKRSTIYRMQLLRPKLRASISLAPPPLLLALSRHVLFHAL